MSPDWVKKISPIGSHGSPNTEQIFEAFREERIAFHIEKEVSVLRDREQCEPAAWFDGENRTRLQDPEAVQRGALKGESYEPVDDYGIEFPNLSIGVAGARCKGRS